MGMLAGSHSSRVPMAGSCLNWSLLISHHLDRQKSSLCHLNVKAHGHTGTPCRALVPCRILTPPTLLLQVRKQAGGWQREVHRGELSCCPPEAGSFSPLAATFCSVEVPAAHPAF